ncbi:D-ribose pyranase [Spirochaetia bacterium]|nr:D-ribose pyranase [Spirochaetia bacterium]GHV92489.1 D-ribose pyranase [Spirochaetia bacterium]
MLKSGILHPQLVHLLASTGHLDTLVIADAGLPLPLNVERVDLAWKKNEPRLLPVLKTVLKDLVVEKAYLAEEIKTKCDPSLYKEILSVLGAIPVEYVPHPELKKMTTEARGIIRTGEFIPYPSIVLVAGCAY